MAARRKRMWLNTWIRSGFSAERRPRSGTLLAFRGALPVALGRRRAALFAEGKGHRLGFHPSIDQRGADPDAGRTTAGRIANVLSAFGVDRSRM